MGQWPGWTKLFPFGKTISEPQSWSRTRLDGMIGLELVYRDKKLGLYGSGQYWQSDAFEVDVIPDGVTLSTLTKRRIERLVDGHTIARVMDNSALGCMIDFRFTNRPLADNERWLPLINDIPFWLILELDVIKDTVNIVTSKDRI